MRDAFYRAFHRFLAEEAENILNGTSERNLCQRLGVYLDAERIALGLDRYYVDAEYNRQQNGRLKVIIDDNYDVITITCDLILHSRGRIKENDNIIAIEMKKCNRPNAEKVSDRTRLRILTRDSYDGVFALNEHALPEYVCGYQLGLFLELNLARDLFTIQEFEKGELIREHEIGIPALQ